MEAKIETKEEITAKRAFALANELLAIMRKYPGMIYLYDFVGESIEEFDEEDFIPNIPIVGINKRSVEITEPDSDGPYIRRTNFITLRFTCCGAQQDRESQFIGSGDAMKCRGCGKIGTVVLMCE